MVCVTFVLTMIVEFPFVLAVLYRRNRLVLKGAAAKFVLHCMGFTMLFFL